jgi:hypothetical protein
LNEENPAAPPLRKRARNILRVRVASLTFWLALKGALALEEAERGLLIRDS